MAAVPNTPREFDGLGPSASIQRLLGMFDSAHKNPLPQRTKEKGRPGDTKSGDTKPKPKLVPKPPKKADSSAWQGQAGKTPGTTDTGPKETGSKGPLVKKSTSGLPIDKGRGQAEKERQDWARQHPDNQGPKPPIYTPPKSASSKPTPPVADKQPPLPARGNGRILVTARNTSKPIPPVPGKAKVPPLGLGGVIRLNAVR